MVTAPSPVAEPAVSPDAREEQPEAWPCANNDGCFVISVAAELVKLHPQTLRHYERLGLIKPERTGGNVRRYSARDIARLRRIQDLMDNLGVNLAGVEVILRMHDLLEAMRAAYEHNEAELQRLRSSSIPRENGEG
jgi:MerR family transcriptional regulator/heat shock protein HspR